jgi:hypothetical protein
MQNVHFLLAIGLTLMSAGVIASCIGFSGLRGSSCAGPSCVFHPVPGANTRTGDGAYSGPGSHIHFSASMDRNVPPLGLRATSIEHTS